MPEFTTSRRVPQTPRQMFDLVADVERYPEFLPLCEGLRVKSRERNGDHDALIAVMSVGYGAIHESFTSRVDLDPTALTVTTTNVDGPFRFMENTWSFSATPTGGTDVEFFIRYAFKSPMLQLLVGAMFERAFRHFTEAFEERANQIYGRPGV